MALEVVVVGPDHTRADNLCHKQAACYRFRPNLDLLLRITSIPESFSPLSFLR